MGIDVQLRLESGKVIAEVLDAGMVLSRATQGAFSNTRLLRYLVPWGNAIFNQSQAADLSDDIRQVIRDHRRTPLADILQEILVLVDRQVRQTHTYLWFVGD